MSWTALLLGILGGVVDLVRGVITKAPPATPARPPEPPGFADVDREIDGQLKTDRENRHP